MWAEDNQVILPARTALFLSLPECPYPVKRFGFNKCYSIQLHGIAAQNPGAKQEFKERTIAAEQSCGEISPQQLPWGIWFSSIIQFPEMGVEGSSAPGTGEERGAEIGHCWLGIICVQQLLPSPCTSHTSSQNCNITCPVNGPRIQEKPGRCFSSQTACKPFPCPPTSWLPWEEISI